MDKVPSQSCSPASLVRWKVGVAEVTENEHLRYLPLWKNLFSKGRELAGWKGKTQFQAEQELSIITPVAFSTCLVRPSSPPRRWLPTQAAHRFAVETARPCEVTAWGQGEGPETEMERDRQRQRLRGTVTETDRERHRDGGSP